MGTGMLWTLALLGGLRELIGNGTLFSGIDMVIPGLQPLQLLPADYPGFLLALLPPGAFIVLGCLIAWKNWIEAAPRASAAPHTVPASPGRFMNAAQRCALFERLKAANPAPTTELEYATPFQC
jgi:Predicted NADH:ubiquinone oxidoreductase, subunit RnfE